MGSAHAFSELNSFDVQLLLLFVFQTRACVIDGICYGRQEFKQGDVCLKCHPYQNRDEWTKFKRRLPVGCLLCFYFMELLNDFPVATLDQHSLASDDPSASNFT